ncbi:MAG: response regulator transcription factor [bacterium]|nr:response regulator transcription factor [bacterium]
MEISSQQTEVHLNSSQPAVSSVLMLEVAGAFRIQIVTYLRAAPDLKVVGAMVVGPEALAFVRRTAPDIAVMDADRLDGPLLDHIHQLREASPHTRLLVLADDCPGEELRPALNSGLWGYLHRDAPQDVLVWALRAVARGRIVLYCSLSPDQFGLREKFNHGPGGALNALSPREAEVLAAIAGGHTDTQIACRLRLSVSTVKTHVRSILRKTGGRNRAGAIAMGFRNGAL